MSHGWLRPCSVSPRPPSFASTKGHVSTPAPGMASLPRDQSECPRLVVRAARLCGRPPLVVVATRACRRQLCLTPCPKDRQRLPPGRTPPPRAALRTLASSPSVDGRTDHHGPRLHPGARDQGPGDVSPPLPSILPGGGRWAHLGPPAGGYRPPSETASTELPPISPAAETTSRGRPNCFRWADKGCRMQRASARRRGGGAGTVGRELCPNAKRHSGEAAGHGDGGPIYSRSWRGQVGGAEVDPPGNAMALDVLRRAARSGEFELPRPL